MSKTRSANSCAYTFSDGRRCRALRSDGHALFCYFHARKQAQAQAAEKTGRDISFFLSGDYLSACDLSLALGRVFAAAARGDIKPRTASTLAYLGQTLLQTIQVAQHEYIEPFHPDDWRDIICAHAKENENYLNPRPPQQPPHTTAKVPQSAPQPPATVPCSAGRSPAASPQPPAPCSAGFTSASSPSPAASSPKLKPKSQRASESTPPAPQAPVSVTGHGSRTTEHGAEAGLKPASPLAPMPPQASTSLPAVVTSAAPPSSPAQSPAASRNSTSEQIPKPAAAAPSTNNSSSVPSQPAVPTPASQLPGFGKPANWEVLIPSRPLVGRRRRQLRPWYLPE